MLCYKKEEKKQTKPFPVDPDPPFIQNVEDRQFWVVYIYRAYNVKFEIYFHFLPRRMRLILFLHKLSPYPASQKLSPREETSLYQSTQQYHTRLIRLIIRLIRSHQTHHKRNRSCLKCNLKHIRKVP